MRTTPAAGAWSDLVVICAANHWDGAMKLADPHLAENLARHLPVLYVDPPVSHLTRWRRPELRDAVRRPRLRLLGPRLARLTPLVLPGPERSAMAPLTTALVSRQIRRAIRRLGAGRPRAVIATSALIRTLGVCDEHTRVYWAQDDFVAGAALFGVAPERIRAGETALAAAADIVVASNQQIAAVWRARGREPVLIPFGCDAERFASSDAAPPAADVHLTAPVAGFVGHLGERIDVPLLEAVARRDRSLLLVGPRHPRFQLERLDALLQLANVQWVGPKRFEELPSYQRVIDVGLVPYTGSDFNKGSFPLKTLEYLAAGRPVVSTDLPGTRWLDTDLVTIASTPEAFADAVDRALAVPRDPVAVAARRAFAARHSWRARAEDFARLLGVDPVLTGVSDAAVP